MNRIVLSLLIGIALVSCHRPAKVVESWGEMVLIDSTMDAIADSAYLAYLSPIKADLETQLNIPIGYAPKGLEVYTPECPMLNWASDALLAMAQQRYPGKVDIAVVNMGGMRCNWGAGDITFRHVFELMPFDNELVVLTLSGKDLMELCSIFAQGYGEGVAGLRMEATNKQVKSVKIAGREIDIYAYYKVATSDYLSQGNDRMVPLKNSVEIWRSEEKIRDLYIEYIKQVKTVEATVDGRMKIN